jgi:Zn-dependent peptidase ImmA (M78 family)/transcriptional regulator with XRE-family HTH domain
MSNQRKAVNPNMVILSREARGLSQKELADSLGVTQGRISKIEMGLLPVPNDLLETLSCVLDYPAHFFFQEGSLAGVGMIEIFHRKRQDVPKKILNKAYAQMDIRLRHIAALLRAVDIPCNVPRLDIDEYSGHAEEIARLLRERWHLPRGPIQDLTRTVEDAGIVVIPIDFETPRIDAISRWIPGLPPLFFVNKDSPKDRYRYSLTHELGHVVMHALPNTDIEEQANQFAAEFLLPERDIRADLNNLDLAKLTILKRYWKVSMAAILHRAEDLGAITANQARYLWAQMARAGYKTHEPIELDVEGEQPNLLDELIETYRKDLGYSIADLQEVIPLNEEELWSQYLQGRDQPPLRIIQR